MAHNTRVRADADAWSPGPVTNAEFNALDAGQFKSINGDDGGTWAPAAAIVIGGAGIDVSGPGDFDDLRGSISNILTVVSGGNFNVSSSGNVNLNSGSHTYLEGTFHADGGDINLTSNSDINLASGSGISLASGAGITLASGSTVNASGTTNLLGTSDVQVASGAVVHFTDPLSATTAQRGTHKIYTPSDFQLVDTSGDGATEWRMQTGYAEAIATGDDFHIGLAALPERATITSITALVHGASHSGWPLGTMPSVKLYRQSAAGVLTLEGQEWDGSASQGAYEVQHNITLSGLSELVLDAAGNDQCFIQITGESGANAVAGLRVYRVRVDFTMETIVTYY